MKNLTVLLVAAALILPASAALAQVGAAAAPGGGGGGGGGPAGGDVVYETCTVTDIGPGFRATLEQISKAKNATVLPLAECEELYVEQRFGVGGQSAAIEENKRLYAHLRGKGVAPQHVRGVQIRHGKLIVYADAQ